MSVLQTDAFLYIGDVVMATITKKQMEEYERLRRDRDNGRVLTPDGLRLICAAYENDPEKIGIHMLEIGIDGVITHNGKRDKKQYHFVFDIIFRTDVGV